MRWTVFKKMLRRMGFQNFTELTTAMCSRKSLGATSSMLCDWRIARANGTDMLCTPCARTKTSAIPLTIIITITAEVSADVVAEAGAIE